MAHPAVEAFRASLDAGAPPVDLSAPLVALWWAGKDEWQKAHAIVQNADGCDAAWVHAYLHRAEGDLGNAGYWYRRAGQPEATGTLLGEWNVISAALLNA